ncbi:hypothetical protein SELMODRAFT_410978 [Selaginella moellendorffii]|uniref:Uncharacterized protein n=1 Tax=Selaginella moellendorffii TaxID=88036 RepID=D8RHL9_SELML|nr:hypothetical protein SELMODRAFT_410978 [Selaginella moellendorffii]
MGIKLEILVALAILYLPGSYLHAYPDRGVLNYLSAMLRERTNTDLEYEKKAEQTNWSCWKQQDTEAHRCCKPAAKQDPSPKELRCMYYIRRHQWILDPQLNTSGVFICHTEAVPQFGVSSQTHPVLILVAVADGEVGHAEPAAHLRPEETIVETAVMHAEADNLFSHPSLHADKS